MSETTFRKYYAQTEFTGMAGEYANADQFETYLSTVALGSPVVDVYAVGTHSIAVEWAELPPPGDIVLVDAAVIAFAAQPTTSEPFELNSFAATTATTTTPVDKISFTTPPLEAGTYQILWASMLRMVAAVAGTGVRALITLTRSGGTSIQQESHWDLAQKVAFNGGITFRVTAGQTIGVLLQVNKIGAAAATAEMSGARVTIDKIADPIAA
jgi:hypothetical protein